jgi:hypothetical protein
VSGQKKYIIGAFDGDLFNFDVACWHNADVIVRFVSLVERRADIEIRCSNLLQPELGRGLAREWHANRWAWFIRKKVRIKSKKPTDGAARRADNSRRECPLRGEGRTCTSELLPKVAQALFNLISIQRTFMLILAVPLLLP